MRKNAMTRTSNIKLLHSSNKDSFYLEADRSRITRVLSNLIDNAARSIAEEGTISINLEKKQDGYVTVSVKDTCTGIPDDIQPKLFTKFSSKSLSGTGLGLFISKSIIESHNGKMWAENNSSRGERWATFYFTLPHL
jgi:signal transduction histidine kinase